MAGICSLSRAVVHRVWVDREPAKRMRSTTATQFRGALALQKLGRNEGGVAPLAEEG